VIHGIGVDLLRVERGRQLWARFGERASAKLLHPAEHALLAAGRDPGAVLARSFAVKEAFVKALGSGFRGVDFKEIGAMRDGDGPPRLLFSERLAARLRAQGVGAAHLSLSDEAGLICAYVVLERTVGTDSLNSAP